MRIPQSRVPENRHKTIYSGSRNSQQGLTCRTLTTKIFNIS